MIPQMDSAGNLFEAHAARRSPPWGVRPGAGASHTLTPDLPPQPKTPVDRTVLNALAFSLTDSAIGGGAIVGLFLWNGSFPVWGSVAVGLMLVVHAGLGLYPGFGLRPAERLRRRWLGSALVFLTIASCAVALDGLEALALLPGGLLILLTAPLAEDIVRCGLHRCGLWGKSAHVNNDATALLLMQNWQLGFLPTLAPNVPTRVTSADDPAPGRYDSILRVQDVGLLACLRSSSSAPLARWVGEMAVAKPRRVPWRGMKRTVDLCLVALLLPLALPLMALTAGLIYLVDPGPVFYGQFRRGLHGKPVRIWKLRSMYQDSQRRLERLLAEDLEAAAEWYARFKLSRDPRVLPWIGAFIRRYSIDELPQLWNVLRGDLSLVGPRVFIDYDLDVYSPEDLHLRQSVLPGLTGLWQVSVRSDGDNRDKARYDSAYVRTWSFWLDLDILYRTVGVVLTGRGGV